MKCECKRKSVVTKEMEYRYTDEELPYVNHEPNKCKNPVTQKYNKEGKIIYLCSNCD